MKKVVVAVVLLAVVLGTGGYAVAQSRGSDASYRTATARTASVQKTLNLSGTVSSAGRRDLSFGAAGSVRNVSVKVGKRVRRNQVLARLDPQSLDATVTAAVATLAKAKAQLVDDEDAQSDSVAATAAAEQAAQKAQAQARRQAKAQAVANAQAAAAQSAAQAQLRKQQQAVTSAQSAASAALAAATAALKEQQSACSNATGTSTDTGSTTDADSSGQACSTALAKVQGAQQTVADKQQALQAAIATLTRTVTSSTSHSSSGSSGSSGHSGASSAPSSSSGSSSGASGSSARGGGAVTAATLARDQASIDTATAELAEARSGRESATLRAPFAGRIVKVAVSKGDAVSASDAAFVLVGSGVTEVTTSVTSTQLASVRRGQRVTVTPAGWSRSLSGEVTLVGLLPDSSSSYPLVVTVQSSAAIAEDTTASLAIVTGSTNNAVTVPTSAVTRAGTRAFVQVLTGTSTVTRSVVTVGVVGNRVTSITAGLKAGQQVVLADLDAALPSSTSTTGTRRFGTGGFGGTGGPPAGGAPGR